LKVIALPEPIGGGRLCFSDSERGFRWTID
jgi:hypothetical protein